MLDKVEQLAPQWFLAVVAIAVTVGVLLYNNPPHQLCDTQKNTYIKKQKKFLASKTYEQFLIDVWRQTIVVVVSLILEDLKKL